MSKVGKKIILIPDGVTLTHTDGRLTAVGKLGKEATAVDTALMLLKIDETKVSVEPKLSSKTAQMVWGTQRASIANIIKGVSEGFKIDLEINGVGYKANVQGQKLTLALGYSHDVIYDVPEGVTVECAKPTLMSVFGTNKQLVGQVAAKIRGFRPPEPYKGKGIKYSTEIIVRKEGKKK